MRRVVLALAALAWVPTAQACPTRSSRPETWPVRPAAPPARPQLPPARPPVYRLTPNSRVFLDGRPRDYGEIPAGARVVYLEVTPENEIVRVDFRTPRPNTVPEPRAHSDEGPHPWPN